jgi:hypothetical protein
MVSKIRNGPRVRLTPASTNSRRAQMTESMRQRPQRHAGAEEDARPPPTEARGRRAKPMNMSWVLFQLVPFLVFATMGMYYCYAILIRDAVELTAKAAEAMRTKKSLKAETRAVARAAAAHAAHDVAKAAPLTPAHHHPPAAAPVEVAGHHASSSATGFAAGVQHTTAVRPRLRRRAETAPHPEPAVQPVPHPVPHPAAHPAAHPALHPVSHPASDPNSEAGQSPRSDLPGADNAPRRQVPKRLMSLIPIKRAIPTEIPSTRQ